MKKAIEKVLSNPLILLLTLHNEIRGFIDYLIAYNKPTIFKMHIDYPDMIFRVVFGTLLWLLYREHLKSKSNYESRIKELETKANRLNKKILILERLGFNADEVLMHLFTEMRDKHTENNATLLKILKERLNVTGIGQRPEQKEVSNLKVKLNEKLDEEEEALIKLLHDNTGFEI